MFVVEGGIFTNTEFKAVDAGTQEFYGPFETYAEAYEVWSGKARAQIDICCHRLVIKEV